MLITFLFCRRSSSSSSDEEQPKKKVGSTHLKPTRQVEIGWFHCDDTSKKNYIQVRAKQGGGTRKIDIVRNATKEEILQKAVHLFFERGVSLKGRVDDLNIELWDYKHYPVLEEYTVEKMFKMTGFSRLKFYIATSKKTDKPHTIPSTATSNTLIFNNETEADPPLTPCTSQTSDNGASNITFDDLVQDVLGSECYEWVASEVPGTSEIVNDQTICNEPLIVTIHRGRVMDELIAAFASLSEDCGRIQIRMVLPNGTYESGQDFGGIFRDCLSEFWETFYDTCTNGTLWKVPILRHDFNEKWIPIAKILHRGWKEERYFPIKLCPSFIQYCIFGKVTSDVLEDYLNTLGQNERDVLKAALSNFSEVDGNELLEILGTIDCKTFVNESNIKTVLKEIAYKEILHQSKHIMDCWRDILQNLMTLEEFAVLYTKCKPTPKLVLALLKVIDEPLDAECTTTLGFLKKFIRECDVEKLSRFLRFCTGADILTGNDITVTFNNSNGFGRTPVGRTCGCILELPNTYTTFPEFRNEMNTLLQSNVWVMDII